MSREATNSRLPDTRQFSTFFLDGQFFGVEVLSVQEVIRYQEMTRAPLAPAMVKGLINLRGQIVTAIDIRQRLGMPARPADKLPMNVVVRSDDGVVSLLVDSIGEVVEVGDDAYERPPKTLSAAAQELVKGVYKLKERLLLILDTEKAISLPGLNNRTTTVVE